MPLGNIVDIVAQKKANHQWSAQTGLNAMNNNLKKQQY
jgi:hypothetical protein